MYLLHFFARCVRLSDGELWAAVPRIVKHERGDLVLLLIHLAEVQRRDLHLKHAYSGLFRYLLKLGFSEWESRARAIAAVAGRKYPSILRLLRGGRINLTAVAMLGTHFTAHNHRALLRKACRRSTRELQAVVAGLDPEAGRRDVIRVVSAPCPSPEAHAAAAPPQSPAATVSAAPGPGAGLFSEIPLETPRPEARPGERRLRFSFDAGEELDRMISRARDLLRHKNPAGLLEPILLDALQALLDRIDPERRLERRIARSRRRPADAGCPAGRAVEEAMARV